MNSEQILAMLNHKNRDNRTALIWAALNNRPAIAQKLLQTLLAAARNAGMTSEQILVIINHTDREGRTALSFACGKTKEIIKAFLNEVEEETKIQNLLVKSADFGGN